MPQELRFHDGTRAFGQKTVEPLLVHDHKPRFVTRGRQCPNAVHESMMARRAENANTFSLTAAKNCLPGRSAGAYRLRSRIDGGTMTTLFAFIMAVAPALFLLRYYDRQDRQRPEPRRLVLKIFILGIAGIIPALVIELAARSLEPHFAGSPLGLAFFRAFAVAALCEEWIKYQVVMHFAFALPEFDEVTDGIVYTVVASLGFACFENVMYVMGSDLTTAIARAFTAVPMHAFAAGIMGYYIGTAKFAGEDRPKLLRKGLFLAVLIHGLYDFILFATPAMERRGGPIAGFLPFLVVPLLAIVFVSLRRRIRLALADDRASGRS